MRIKNKKLVIMLPKIVYDIAQWVFFPVNYVICLLCYLQPKKSVWNEEGFESQKLTGSGLDLTTVKEQIINGDNLAYNEEDLVKLYGSLPDVSAKDQMVGHSWNGKILRTNASVLDLAEWFVIRPLNLIGVNWGKRYRDQHKGDPLLFRWLSTVYIPIPIWGNVGMVDIKWRNSSTATMNYDHQPWKDFFKVLKDEDGELVLLGVWTHKHIAGGWFKLTLDRDVPTL